MSDRASTWPARLQLDPSAFVAPGAVVVGEVTLGARTSVWFQCVLRGDSAAIEIGDDSNVQDGTIVHEDEGYPVRIGARVTIGHRAVIHGCTIEDDCLIGMGAIVLTGARIGTGSLIGAGALVREGQAIPPGSLAVGAPARVIGPVGDPHREAIRNGSEHYVELSRSYLRRGFARPHPRDPGDGIDGRDPGPMTWLEWGRLLRVLSDGPATIEPRVEGFDTEAWLRAPADRWSAIEVLCHLRDVDREIFLPRIERILREREPRFEAVDAPQWAESRRYREQSPGDVLQDWRAARARIVDCLQPLVAADWIRTAVHSRRGPYPLGDMVREAVDHDLAHRHQLVQALVAPR